MSQTDIAVCLLPLTRETEGIFCARTFAMMPKGAMVINVGRGKHVVEKDLIAALDSGQLSYAALDALWPEPLPPESPLWAHPKVTVMPHVARRPTVAQLVTEIAAQHPQRRTGRRPVAGDRQVDGVLRFASRDTEDTRGSCALITSVLSVSLWFKNSDDRYAAVKDR